MWKKIWKFWIFVKLRKSKSWWIRFRSISLPQVWAFILVFIAFFEAPRANFLHNYCMVETSWTGRRGVWCRGARWKLGKSILYGIRNMEDGFGGVVPKRRGGPCGLPRGGRGLRCRRIIRSKKDCLCAAFLKTWRFFGDENWVLKFGL